MCSLSSTGKLHRVSKGSRDILGPTRMCNGHPHWPYVFGIGILGTLCVTVLRLSGAAASRLMHKTRQASYSIAPTLADNLHHLHQSLNLHHQSNFGSQYTELRGRRSLCTCGSGVCPQKSESQGLNAGKVGLIVKPHRITR